MLVNGLQVARHRVELHGFRRVQQPAVDDMAFGDATKLAADHQCRPVNPVLDIGLPAFFSSSLA